MSANSRKLGQAITRKNVVVLRNYNPLRKGVVGDREVEPHALGKSVKKNRAVLRAWVLKGESHSGLSTRKRWRMFRIDRIGGVDVLPKTFHPRRGFKPADKHMKRNPRVVLASEARRSARLNPRRTTARH